MAVSSRSFISNRPFVVLIVKLRPMMASKLWLTAARMPTRAATSSMVVEAKQGDAVDEMADQDGVDDPFVPLQHGRHPGLADQPHMLVQPARTAEQPIDGQVVAGPQPTEGTL